MALSEVFWDRLLLLMEERRVVPVVGPDLLRVEREGETTGLYAWLATRLAEYLEVSAEDLPEGDELHTVVCRFVVRDRQNRQLVYSALKTIWSREGELPVPTPLLQLAEIRAFRLFVTTTFDPLLENALNQVRHGGEPRARVLSYAPDERQDLPGADPGPSTVYHLFGRLSARPAFVVTQEDTVEFFHSLQSEHRQPERLFEALDRSNLLILGSDMSGWLARFFMRMSKRERLLGARDTTDYLVDRRLKQDPGLVFFLQNLTNGIQALDDLEPAEFIAELHGRWTERHPEGAEAEPDGSRASWSWSHPGAVFLSYASEDREQAIRVKEALEERVEVFFDKDDLRSGDDWQAKLRRCIRESSVFVPILSRNILTTARRHFRDEWYEAIEEKRKETQIAPFIHPVVIDDVPLDDPAIPERFAAVHATRLQAGRLPDEFVDRVVQLHQDFQLR